MAPEAIRSAERCATHPGIAAVATCASCDRALCLACALPVRGRVLGTECLPDEIADGAPAPAPGHVEPGVGSRLAASGILVSLAASFLPWTRFGTGSGMAGAWGTGRWSLMAGFGAAAGAFTWLIARITAQTARRWACAGLAGCASIVLAGAVLAVLNGPPLTKPAAAPWISMIAAGAAALGGVLGVARSRHPRD